MDRDNLIIVLKKLLKDKEKERVLFDDDKIIQKKIDKQIRFIKEFISMFEKVNDVSYEKMIEEYKELLQMRFKIKLKSLYNEEFLKDEIKTMNPKVLKIFHYEEILQEIEKNGEEQALQNRMNKEMEDIEDNIKMLNNIVYNKTFMCQENEKIQELPKLEIQDEEIKKMTETILKYIDSAKEEILKELKKQ